MSKFVSKHENYQRGPAGITPIAENMKNNFSNNIFVNNIDLDVSEDQLREKFEVTGKILNLKLIKKPHRYC